MIGDSSIYRYLLTVEDHVDELGFLPYYSEVPIQRGDIIGLLCGDIVEQGFDMFNDKYQWIYDLYVNKIVHINYPIQSESVLGVSINGTISKEDCFKIREALDIHNASILDRCIQVYSKMYPAKRRKE